MSLAVQTVSGQGAQRGFKRLVQPSSLSPDERRIYDFLVTIVPAEGRYCLGQMLPKGFGNSFFSDLCSLTLAIADAEKAGRDTYFACASYGTDGRRTQTNVVKVRAFWLDIDCGADKEASGDGYADTDAALTAVDLFCDSHSLPRPMVIKSGGGLHCYWPLDQDIDPTEWRETAREIKALTCGTPRLLADPSRTADMASVLRPVGTTNRKPARNGAKVEMLRKADPVPYAAFKTGVKAAVAQIASPQPANNNAKPSQRALASNLNANIQSGLNQTPAETADNIARVKEALACLEPDAPYPDWRDIVFALHSTGWACAEDLARAWSAGGDPHAPTATKYESTEFDKLWVSAKADGGITLGTLIWRAHRAGWTNHIPAMGPLWLLEMNSKYAWMDKEAGIYRIEYGDFIDTRLLKGQYKNRTENWETAAKPRLVDIATLWEAHPNRRGHKRLVLAPGQGEIVGQNELNTWQGFAIEAARGDVRPFLKLLTRLVPDRGERRYLLLWMAHLIQRPGVKMNAAVVIWSPLQGVGKNLIAECLTGIIGSKHSTIIGSSELASRFNGWAKDKVFVLGDEVSGSDKRDIADKLKGYVTGTTIQIDEKNQPVREAENLVNFMFLSNHADAVFMQENDRRFFVVESPAARLVPAEAEAFVQWRDNGGLGHLRAFLEQVSLAKFKPKAPPPKTAAHSQMIFSNKSDFEQWAHDLMANGGRAVGSELTTAALLGRLYNQQTGKPEPSARTVNKVFQGLGAQHIGQVADPSGTSRRTIALKRPDYWKAALPADRETELAKGVGARL